MRFDSVIDLKGLDIRRHIDAAVALKESELQRRIESVVAVKESEVDARIKSAVALKESEVLNRIHSALALKESEVEDRIKSAVALNESELQRRIDTAVIAALVDKDAVLRKQLELDNRSYKHNLDDNFNKDKESLQRAFKSEVTAKVQKKLDLELQYLQSKFKSSVESESIVKQGQISTIVENLFDDAMIQLSLLFSV